VNEFMEYLPATKGPAPAQVPQQGAEKYHGEIATGYDVKRVNDPKWTIEQQIIEGLLADLPAGSHILDCPVGTGRFLPYYVSKNFKFTGIDLSGDMLIQSALKMGVSPEDVNTWVQQSNARQAILPVDIDEHGALEQGDVRQLHLADKSVDCAVMCRLTRWLLPADCQVAMKQLQRVCRQRIIWTARVANHQHARTVELFEQALDGWKITQNLAGYVLDYRILMAEPV
jgi:ubiquinone/menaquinone biosynthesis C-methylase UbiE